MLNVTCPEAVSLVYYLVSGILKLRTFSICVTMSSNMYFVSLSHRHLSIIITCDSSVSYYFTQDSVRYTYIFITYALFYHV